MDLALYQCSEVIIYNDDPDNLKIKDVYKKLDSVKYILQYYNLKIFLFSEYLMENIILARYKSFLNLDWSK